jgi:hypothetical protein
MPDGIIEDSDRDGVTAAARSPGRRGTVLTQIREMICVTRIPGRGRWHSVTVSGAAAGGPPARASD